MSAYIHTIAGSDFANAAQTTLRPTCVLESACTKAFSPCPAYFPEVLTPEELVGWEMSPPIFLESYREAESHSVPSLHREGK